MIQFEIDEEGLDHLKQCWSEATRLKERGRRGLEACVHEMAHVLNVTGSLVHHDVEVHVIIARLHPLGRDYDEIRASAVTRLVMDGLGYLNPKFEDEIFTGMYMNVSSIPQERLHYFWGKMRDSRRTRRMALEIIGVLVAFEVVRLIFDDALGGAV